MVICLYHCAGVSETQTVSDTFTTGDTNTSCVGRVEIHHENGMSVYGSVTVTE